MTFEAEGCILNKRDVTVSLGIVIPPALDLLLSASLKHFGLTSADIILFLVTPTHM